MKSLSDTADRVLQRAFFQPTAAQSLSLFRCIYCGILVWRILVDGPKLSAHFGTVTWNPIPPFETLGIGLMSADAFAIWRSVLVTALALTALGVFTRVSATAAWISYFVYIGTYLGFTKTAGTSYVYHSKNIVVIVLMILSVAPAIGRWGFDGWRNRGWNWRVTNPALLVTDNWPRQLIVFVLGVSYFGAGYCKLVNRLPGSLLWADGETLQASLISKYLMLNHGPALWLAQFFGLCLLLGVATLVLELTFFLVVFCPRLTRYYVTAGLGFHLCIFLTMDINFFPYFAPVYFVFLDWSKLTAAGRQLRSTVARMLPSAFAAGTGTNPHPAMAPSAAPLLTGNSRFARRFVLTVSLVSVLCVFARVEYWPLSDYRVFKSRRKLEKTWVYRVAGVTPEGERRYLRYEEYPMGSPIGWWITSRRLKHYRKDPQAQNGAVTDVARHLARAQPGKYEAIVVVKRGIRGTPGQDGFAIVEEDALRCPVIAESRRPPIERMARSARHPVY